MPVAAMATVALIAVIRYDRPEPWEETFLDGFEQFLLLAMTAWMGTAVAVGWAIRLWRSGRRVWASALGVVVLLPWVVFLAGP